MPRCRWNASRRRSWSAYEPQSAARRRFGAGTSQHSTAARAGGVRGGRGRRRPVRAGAIRGGQTRRGAPRSRHEGHVRARRARETPRDGSGSAGDRAVGRRADVVPRAGPGRGRVRVHQQARCGRGRPLDDRAGNQGYLAVELNQTQQDALIELLNIGFGRAAAALSQLTGHRVLLEVPQVSVHPIDELNTTLRTMLDDQVASVHQIFSGPAAGDALLILDHRAAGMLKELLTNETPLPLPLDASAREVLTEVGNILLNACQGTFGNNRQVLVSFSDPHLNLDTLHDVMRSLLVNREGLRYALVVHAGFNLRHAEVKGDLVIVFSVASLDRLIRAVEEWEQREGRA